MGGAQSSENVSKQDIRSTVEILDQSVQNCQSSVDQSQIIYAGNQSTQNIWGNITQDQVSTMDLNCVANVSNSSQVISDISQSASQLAKSISQNFALNFTETKAKNLANNVIQNRIGITNQAYQNCTSNVYQSQQIVVTGGATQNIWGAVDQEETSNLIRSCTMTNSNTNAATSSISQVLSQTAISIEQNSLAIIAIAVIFVVLLFAFFEFGVVELLNWKTLAVIGVFIIIYLIVSYELGIWPFKPKPAKWCPSSSPC